MDVAEVVQEWRTPEWTLGDRMAKAREMAGLTQGAMAELIAAELQMPMSKQRLSNWENDLNQPRDLLGVLRAWSRITRVPMTWIVQDTSSGIRCSMETALQDVRDGWGDTRPDDYLDAAEAPLPPAERHLRLIPPPCAP